MGINIFQLLFLIPIIFSIDQSHGGSSPEEVNLPINNNNDQLNVHLRKIDSYLANEHLPVYIIREQNPFVLEQMKTIMESVGKFSMYHDPETTSAAVFFEKTNKFNGVIGVDYIIQDLPYLAAENKVYISERTVFPPEPSIFTSSGPDLPSDNDIKNEDFEPASTKLKHDVVYIETLIMVDNTILSNEIVSKYCGRDYKLLVRYILSLFNSVDVLFAKVEEPKVKINIAGIIISEEPETFGFLTRRNCVETKYYSNSGTTIKMRSLPADCITTEFSSYISQLKNNQQFPHSFDNVIFLTGLGINTRQAQGENQRISILGGFQQDLKWKNAGEPRIPNTFSFTAVQALRHYADFVTIAHELAHGFNVPEHDAKPYVDANGECCRYIMAAGVHNCKKCLRWSPRSARLFRSFFNSVLGCLYADKPKSLHSGLSKGMTEQEQCVCYDYKSARVRKKCQRARGTYPLLEYPLCTNSTQRIGMEGVTSTRSLALLHTYRTIFSWKCSNICDLPLQCLDRSGSVVEPTLPMDGTPCGRNKVCWQRGCRRIGH